MRDRRYRIYKDDGWFWPYEITRGSKDTGQIYTSHGVAQTLWGAKRLVARLIRKDQRAQAEKRPVWTQEGEVPK